MTSISFIGRAIPIFVIGLLMILFFSGTGLGWFPSGKAHSNSHYFQLICLSSDFECSTNPFNFFFGYIWSNYFDFNFWATFFHFLFSYLIDEAYHLILPLSVLVLTNLALFSRIARSEALEIFECDYILSAYANGLPTKTILRKHIFRVILPPLLLFLAINFGEILAGSPITEFVFTWPGLGQYYLASLQSFDYPVIMAITMIITLMIFFANLTADVIFIHLDPKLDYNRR